MLLSGTATMPDADLCAGLQDRQRVRQPALGGRSCRLSRQAPAAAGRLRGCARCECAPAVPDLGARRDDDRGVCGAGTVRSLYGVCAQEHDVPLVVPGAPRRAGVLPAPVRVSPRAPALPSAVHRGSCKFWKGVQGPVITGGASARFNMMCIWVIDDACVPQMTDVLPAAACRKQWYRAVMHLDL